jgi:heterodisulfide reductase subunit A
MGKGQPDKFKSYFILSRKQLVLNKPALQQFDLPVRKAGLIIGGGVAGMEAALGLAGQGYKVDLVEKKGFLGGHALKLNHTWNGEAVRPYVDDLVQRLTNHPKIDVHLNSEVSSVQGFVENFTSRITGEGRSTEVEHGAAVIAIGGHSLKPKEYLYKENPRVLLSLKMDQALREKNPLVTGAKRAVFTSAWAPGNRSGLIVAGSAAPIPWKTPSGLRRSIPTWISTSFIGICVLTGGGKTFIKRRGPRE